MRLGIETPRIFTKPLRELTPETSDGFFVIKFAEEVLGVRLIPWEKWLLIHALEVLPNELYRFRTVIVLVARQNGKTLVMQILALWHLYVRGSKMVIGTAQDLNNAEKAWRETVETAEDIPELDVEIEEIVKGTSKKAFVLKSRERYEVAAANRRGARGKSGDLVLLDELREHSNWDSWSAATKTTLARPEAQVFTFSNAGDAMSIVLRYLRALAHEALGWPDGDDDRDVLEGRDEDADFDEWEEEFEADTLGLFEWSVPPGMKRNNRDGWAQANPSMNHTDIVPNVITERAIAAAMKTDPPHVFDVEVLCRWITTGETGPFTAGKWVTTLDNDARPAKKSPRTLCVDVSWNRETAYIARASRDKGGNPVLDIAAQRAGTEWVAEWLSKRRKKFGAVTLQTNGAPVSSLYDELKKPKWKLNVVDWAGADLGRASGIAYDLVENETLRHLQHPGLDRAATTALPKSMGDTWVIDRKNSPNDAAPLIAAMGALWLLDREPTEPAVSAYEESDLIVL